MNGEKIDNMVKDFLNVKSPKLNGVTGEKRQYRDKNYNVAISEFIVPDGMNLYPFLEWLEKQLEQSKLYEHFYSLYAWKKKVEDARAEHHWEELGLCRCTKCGLKNQQFNEFAGAIESFIKEKEDPSHLVLLCKNSKVKL